MEAVGDSIRDAVLAHAAHGRWVIPMEGRGRRPLLDEREVARPHDA